MINNQKYRDAWDAAEKRITQHSKPAHSLAPGDSLTMGRIIIGVFDATDRNGKLMPNRLRIVCRKTKEDGTTEIQRFFVNRTEHVLLEALYD